MEFDSNSNTDKLVVNGDSTIEGSLSISPISDYYDGSSSFTVSLSDLLQISGTNSIASSFINSSAAASSSPTLTTLIQQSGSSYNDATYSISVQRAANAYSQYATDSNSASVGNALYNGSNTASSGMKDIYKAIDFSNVDGSEVSVALDRLSPTSYANAVQGIFDSDHYLNSVLFSDTVADFKLGNGTYAYVKPFLMHGHRGHGTSGYHDNYNFGAIFGADTIEDNLTKGFYLVANNRFQKTGNSSNVKDNSLSLGLKALVNLNDDNTLKLFTSGYFGINDMKVDKSYVFKDSHSNNKSHFTAYNSSFDLCLSYDYAVGNYTLVPKADIQYSMFYQPNLSEKGGATSVQLESKLFNSLRAGLGLDVVSNINDFSKSTSYQTMFGLAYHRELLSRAGTFTARFKELQNSSFTHEVYFLGKDSLDLNAKLSFFIDKTQCISLNAGTQLYK